MKPGFLHPYRRRLRAALALPAAAFLLYSCDPPASPSSSVPASPSLAVPASPNPAVPEVTRISGLPNMAQIERRLNDQYAASARSTDGVEFDPPSISGITVSAAIKYAEGKLLPMTIGGKDYEIKTVTITREVDGKTIPTRIEYKDTSGTTRKTVTSRYVPPPNAEAEAEGGPALHISGEEKDAAGKILRTFTATEEIQGGKIKLKTTYRRSGKEGFTETLTTENGIPIQKVVTYPDKEAAAKNIKTETITYEKSAAAMFYPARQKLKLTLYEDAEGKETKRDEAQDDGSTITTTRTAEGSTLAVHKKPDGTETQRVETKSDKSTITTTPAAKGGTLAVHKNSSGTETQRVETRSDKSTITTKGTTKELVLHPSVTAIEDKAFKNNDLTSLTIGNGVKTIGLGIFQNNRQLRTVTITGKGPVESNAFKAVFSASGSLRIELIIEDGITAIGDEAFAYNQLTKLTIPSSVTAIGERAFTFNALTKLTIPPSVTAIGERAFSGNKLTSVILSKALYDARGYAFAGNPPGLRFLDHEGRLLGRN